MLAHLKELLKSLLKITIYRPGTTASILMGQLRGYKYIVNDNSGWASIYGGWESESQKIYCQLLQSGQTVYDLGANTGIHSVLFSKLVGSEGKVFAFEPLAENLIELNSIIEINGISNIHIIGKAVGNTIGTLKFKIGKHNKQGSLVGIGCETGDEVEVEITTLDNLIDEGLSLPDFIKIDIEGAESEALYGFSNFIKKSCPSFAIDLHTPEQDIKVGKFFLDYGYKLYRLNSPMSKKLTKQRKLLAEIPRLDLGWPDSKGVWGTIIAIHPTKKDSINKLTHLV
ncbi:MAG: FkbM family methyltransferase [Dolichospermum circinale Clear-D4]|jgi:FkbM family methyltransferase|nr:FkbM family methyltransferase [Dolichospermum circinale Clear-D4]